MNLVWLTPPRSRRSRCLYVFELGIGVANVVMDGKIIVIGKTRTDFEPRDSSYSLGFLVVCCLLFLLILSLFPRGIWGVFFHLPGDIAGCPAEVLLVNDPVIIDNKCHDAR